MEPFSGHAKVMVSLLQDIQENDQRVTMLQLVDKMKVKNKGSGKSSAWVIISGLKNVLLFLVMAFNQVYIVLLFLCNLFVVSNIIVATACTTQIPS